MNQKERLEQIRQKHEKEQYERKILGHRIIFAVAAVIIVVTVIFAVKGCVSSISERREQKKNEQMAAQTMAPTEAPVRNPNEIDQNYYASSAFIGNSFIDGMISYDMINGADYFSKVGLSVDKAMTQSTDSGSVPVIDELKNGKSYSKIFMLFGENELGWVNPETFTEKYALLIDKAREYQPNAKIYLMSITPVTKKVSDENIDNTNNDNIRVYNELIKQLAAEKNVVYADTYSAVATPEGDLPEGCASDGVHFAMDYYKKILLYIQNNNL